MLKNNESARPSHAADIKTVLKEQLAIDETLKQANRVVPFIFRLNGEPSKYFRRA